MIKVDCNFAGFCSNQDLQEWEKEIANSHDLIMNANGEGNDFLGWRDLPLQRDSVADIKNLAKTLREKNDIFVVIGIGGSYLGARAVIEALSSAFASLMPKKNSPIILYAGENLSEDYMADLLEVLKTKDYSLCVISKSGTTTEPAIAFRILKKELEEKYGKEEAKNRIKFFKHIIENCDGYKNLYVDGEAIAKEEDLQRLLILELFMVFPIMV